MTPIKIERKRSWPWTGILAFILSLLILVSVINSDKYGTVFKTVSPAVFAGLLFWVTKKRAALDWRHLLCVALWIEGLTATVFFDTVPVTQDIFVYGAFVLVYILFSSVLYREEELRLIFRFYVFAAVFAALFIYLNWVLGASYSEQWDQRYSARILGVMKDPNYLCAFLSPAVILLEYGAAAKGKGKKQSGVVFLVLVGAILLTGSRSAFLTLLVSSVPLLYGWYRKQPKLTQLFFFCTGVFFLAVVFHWLGASQSLGRLVDIDSYLTDIRFKLWREGLKGFEAHPLLGSGMEAASGYSMAEYGIATHSIGIDVLGNQGLIGAAGFLAAALSFLRVRKKYRYFMTAYVMASFIPLLSINGFVSMTFWLPMILCHILSRELNRKPEIQKGK